MVNVVIGENMQNTLADDVGTRCDGHLCHLHRFSDVGDLDSDTFAR